MFGELVRLILEIWRYIACDICTSTTIENIKDSILPGIWKVATLLHNPS